MAKVDYDAFEGWARLSDLVQKIDPESATIIGCHIALEREIMTVLERTLPRAQFLDQLGYAQKVAVLAAAWAGSDNDAQTVHEALLAFGALRNRVAHGNDDKIPKARAALVEAYRKLHPESGEESIEEMAGGILSFFGDAPTLAEMTALADGLERLVQALPRIQPEH